MGNDLAGYSARAPQARAKDAPMTQQDLDAAVAEHARFARGEGGTPANRSGLCPRGAYLGGTNLTHGCDSRTGGSCDN
jgi:hypothetical protein